MFLLLLYGHNERETETDTTRSPAYPTFPSAPQPNTTPLYRTLPHSTYTHLHTLHSPRLLNPTLPFISYTTPLYPTLSCIPYIPLGSSTQHYLVIAYTALPCPSLLALLHTRHCRGQATQPSTAPPYPSLPYRGRLSLF